MTETPTCITENSNAYQGLIQNFLLGEGNMYGEFANEFTGMAFFGGGGGVFTTCDQSLLTWGERMSLQTI